MVNLNSFLLSVFAPNIRFGLDTKSLRERHQLLLVIYFYLTLYSLIILHECTMFILFRLPDASVLIVLGTIFTAIAFMLIRKGKINEAAKLVAVYWHFFSFSASAICNRTIVGLYSIAVSPIVFLSFNYTSNFRLLNAAICVFQYIFHMHKIFVIFKVTLTDEQSKQVFLLGLTGGACIVFLFILTFIQKSMETYLWKIAETNFVRSENLTKEVLQSVEAKNIFVSSLSHEIRNPLNSMSGSIDYLLGIVKDPLQIKVLKNAKLSSEILLNLVNNVLDAAKLKADKMEVSYAETSFQDIVQKAFAINSENFKEKKIKSFTIFAPNIPQRVWIDPSRILQILMNLISNATKFTSANGKILVKTSWISSEEDGNSKEKLLSITQELGIKRVNRANLGNLNREDSESTFEEFDNEENSFRLNNFNTLKELKKVKGLQDVRRSFEVTSNITSHSVTEDLQSPKELRTTIRHLSSNKVRGFLKVEVFDTGCGIEEKERPNLFEMFSQIQKSNNSQHRGTGLGLWICKQLCQKMNGDITIYSKKDVGTAFVFYIPVDNSKNHKQISSKNLISFNSVNALVVDDFSFNRDLHKLLLEREGIHVTLASNGKEAVEKYKEKGEGYFSFIMMDIQMPVLDGLTAAKQIREYEAEIDCRRTDIFFVSGEYLNENLAMRDFPLQGQLDSQKNGCVQFLKKPVDIQRIKTIIDKYQSGK